jgi:signal transduction histidine kinase
MISKHLLAVALAVIMSSIFAGCQRRTATDPEQNVFYKVTHQAETFGFTYETFRQLQVAFNHSKPLDFKEAFYYYNYGCGYYHTNKKDEIMALKYADSMLIVCDEEGDPATVQAEIAIANLSEGEILFAQKRYNEALECYYKGKMAATKSGDQYILSEYSYRMGMAMYRKENYGDAAQYFINAFEQGGHRNNSFSDFYRRQEVLNNAALSYLHNGKQDSAIWYSNKGLQYIADNANKYAADKSVLIQVAQGVIYGTMGRAYLQSHDTAGVGLLQKSIAINQLPGHENEDALQVQTYLAQHYLDTAFALQLPKAYTLLTAIQHGLDTIHNEDVTIQWNELMSRYNALQGNAADAYTYLTRYNTLHSEHWAAKRALTETNISNVVKIMQDRHDMRLLNANNHLETIYLCIAVIICLLTGTILFLIMRNWRKEKENGHTLALLNEQVEKQKTALEASVKQLNEQVKAKDNILRIVAHDLRNPVSAIATLTRIVSEEYENEEENKEFLEMAQSACKDSLRLIDSIMQLSQQNGSEPLKPKIFDVNEAVMECVELLRPKAQEKQQEIILHSPGASLYTFADNDKISRVVNNLLMNAIKFSFSNSTIYVSVEEKNDNVEIEVKDEGIGIPEDMQDKVFDVFTEARRKGTSKESTFGLGLSICKQIVEAHGGKIWLESKDGLGTSFHVQLGKYLMQQPKLELEEEAA